MDVKMSQNQTTEQKILSYNGCEDASESDY